MDADTYLAHQREDCDRIKLEPPDEGAGCYTATCKGRGGVPAVAKVTLGSFPWLPPDGDAPAVREFWRGSWGVTENMCQDDMDRTVATVRAARPDLKIDDTRGGNDGRDEPA